ncbi:hypothetical protein BDW42DRAFT_171324 [Aspergillus taichungensis]|uniref:Cyanovirin-N domain-containing protein n=1 Tax=Aspergillus taichungensis TaxID=482145 RepID=A0A2J5HS65_9EURO|nr:hypothetical protein BDW42DRAFT_171324 [Aspergillus taichungensis]
MQFFSSIVLLLLSAVGTRAICNPREIGIGNDIVGSETGPAVMLTNDCGVISRKSGESSKSVCSLGDDGGWDREGDILSCNNGVTPWLVQTSGGDFQGCRSTNEKCGGATVSFCCPRKR